MEKSTPKTDSDSLIEQLMALIEERQDEPFTKQEREQLESDFQQKSIQDLTKDIKREKKQLKEYLVNKVFHTSSADKKQDDTYYDDLEKMNIEELELQFKINLINRIKHIQDVNGVRTYEVPELLSKVNSFSVKEVKRMEKHIEKRAESRAFYTEKDLKEEVKKEAEKKKESQHLPLQSTQSNKKNKNMSEKNRLIREILVMHKYNEFDDDYEKRNKIAYTNKLQEKNINELKEMKQEHLHEYDFMSSVFEGIKEDSKEDRNSGSSEDSVKEDRSSVKEDSSGVKEDTSDVKDHTSIANVDTNDTSTQDNESYIDQYKQSVIESIKNNSTIQPYAKAGLINHVQKRYSIQSIKEIENIANKY